MRPGRPAVRQHPRRRGPRRRRSRGGLPDGGDESGSDLATACLSCAAGLALGPSCLPVAATHTKVAVIREEFRQRRRPEGQGRCRRRRGRDIIAAALRHTARDCHRPPASPRTHPTNPDRPHSCKDPALRPGPADPESRFPTILAGAAAEAEGVEPSPVRRRLRRAAGGHRDARGALFAPSMYRDVLDARPTEVEHVPASLARASERRNLPAPSLNAAWFASGCTTSAWRRPCGPAGAVRPGHCGRRGLVRAAATGFRASPYAWGRPAVAVRVARRRWASRARAQRAATVAA
ncbi:ketopantoate reductase C-terminal domain-containing protein [Streptomyces canus]|uniref:ketopantoate reductase C-terminal domain-containing protein n=1 Tax=Streptomyces canus TaxID=58343 RepID=UPI0037DA2F5E